MIQVVNLATGTEHTVNADTASFAVRLAYVLDYRGLLHTSRLPSIYSQEVVNLFGSLVIGKQTIACGNFCAVKLQSKGILR
jgi:hypothetical protein